MAPAWLMFILNTGTVGPGAKAPADFWDPSKKSFCFHIPSLVNEAVTNPHGENKLFWVKLQYPLIVMKDQAAQIAISDKVFCNFVIYGFTKRSREIPSGWLSRPMLRAMQKYAKNIPLSDFDSVNSCRSILTSMWLKL